MSFLSKVPIEMIQEEFLDRGLLYDYLEKNRYKVLGQLLHKLDKEILVEILKENRLLIGVFEKAKDEFLEALTDFDIEDEVESRGLEHRFQEDNIDEQNQNQLTRALEDNHNCKVVPPEPIKWFETQVSLGKKDDAVRALIEYIPELEKLL